MDGSKCAGRPVGGKKHGSGHKTKEAQKTKEDLIKAVVCFLLVWLLLC